MSVTAHGGRGRVQAVEEVCGVQPGLKWPNDPILNGKKLSGILTELSLEAESGRLQYLVVGIGLNVSQEPEDFSPQVRPIATSLCRPLAVRCPAAPWAAAEIRALDRLYRALETGDTAAYLDHYRRSCVNLGKQVQLIAPRGVHRRWLWMWTISSAWWCAWRTGRSGSSAPARSPSGAWTAMWDWKKRTGV